MIRAASVEAQGETSLRAIIIGAGIGGLATAIALRRAGIEPVVLEQADAPAEIGAAITLWSNGIKAADALGVGVAIRDAGGEVLTGDIRSSSGRVLMRTPVAEVGRMVGAPSICLPRAELLRILLDAAGPVRWGARCRDFRADGDGVLAVLEGGEEIVGDVLIGADGLRSVVRSRLLGDEKPRYAGHLCFRAMVTFRHAALPPGSTFESWGTADSFGVVPMAGETVYWFANVLAPRGSRFADPKQALLRRYGGWHEPIRALIEATDAGAILVHEVADRDTVPRWGEERVTLLGDAADPSTPDLGQGGCLAIEDAVVLAACLRGATDVERALRTYESLRIPRANRLTAKSRWFGRIGHQRSAVLCAIRNLCVRLLPQFLTTRDYRAIVDYDAAAAVPLAAPRPVRTDGGGE